MKKKKVNFHEIHGFLGYIRIKEHIPNIINNLLENLNLYLPATRNEKHKKAAAYKLLAGKIIEHLKGKTI